MNKRILSLLVAVALVLSFAPFAPVAVEAEAAELPHPITAENAGNFYCSHCKENKAWTAYTGQATTGHYYLAADYTGKAQTSPNGNVQMCINMNGYNWTPKTNNRAFMLRNNISGNTVTPTVSLMGTGTITAVITANTGTPDGGLIYMHAEGGTFNLYDNVTLVGDAEKDAIRNGGLVYLGGTACTFNMYGGTITGGNIKTNDTWTSAYGGCVYNKGNFNMYGGTISNGTGTGSAQGGCVYTLTGTFKMTGGTISGGSVANNGGNIHVSGPFKMEGGTITGGTSGIYGGNICANGGAIDVTGGTISNGTAATAGGNVMTLTNKTHSFSDCLIIGGVASTGGNIQHGPAAKNTDGTLKASAGTLVLDHCVLLGAEKIEEGAAKNMKGHNLHVGPGQTATLNNCYVKMMQTGGTYTTEGNVYITDGTADKKTTINLNNSIFPINGSGNKGEGQNFKIYFANTQANIGGMTMIQQVMLNTGARPSLYFKKDFVGQVGIRNQQTVTVGNSSPATMKFEDGYTGLGNIIQVGGTGYPATYAVKPNTNTFMVEKAGYTDFTGLGGANGKAAFNFYHGYSKIGGGYVQRYFTSEQAALDAYAVLTDAEYVFVRLGDSVTSVESLTFNGGNNKTLTLNLNGKAVNEITMGAGTTLNLMDSSATAAGSVNVINGGTVSKAFKMRTAQYIVAQDETGAYQSCTMDLTAKAYLRTVSETLAFQAVVSAKDEAIRNAVTEMGIKLYKDNGETLMVTVDYSDYEFTAGAIADLKEEGSYDAARVALASDTSWWTSDISATAYVVIDGEVYESPLKTVNYMNAILKHYASTANNATIQEMIDSSANKAAYSAWYLVAPATTAA